MAVQGAHTHTHTHTHTIQRIYVRDIKTEHRAATRGPFSLVLCVGFKKQSIAVVLSTIWLSHDALCFHLVFTGLKKVQCNLKLTLAPEQTPWAVCWGEEQPADHYSLINQHGCPFEVWLYIFKPDYSFSHVQILLFLFILDLTSLKLKEHPARIRHRIASHCHRSYVGNSLRHLHTTCNGR